MEQKAEELYEDRLRTSQTTVFSRWTGGYGPGLWFQSIQKPVMFWKQSEGCKGSFWTGKFTFADVPVQTLTILDILIVIVHYCLSAQCLLIRKLPLKSFARTLPVSVYFKTINTCSSSEKCGMECTPTIFVKFSAFCSIRLFHFIVSVIVKHQNRLNSYRVLDYVTRVIIPLFIW